MTKHNWNDYRIGRLKALYADGHSCTDIANILGGVTRNAVLGKVHRLKLPLRGYRPGGIVAQRQAGLVPCKPKRQPLPQPRPRTSPARSINLAVLPLPPPSEYDRARLSFLDLDAQHCKWPVGDPQEAGHDKPLFCGEKRIPGSSYCSVHFLRSRQAVTPRRERLTQPALAETVAA